MKTMLRPTVVLARRAKSEVRSHQLDVPVPTSLEKAFVLDSPGEYEVHDILVNRACAHSEMASEGYSGHVHVVRLRAGWHLHRTSG